ncbi:hypothetical protein Pta6605_25280 [Pseudomonas amygdali pv. tabaci]|nr:hypothetical protein Pta6605_25280 [Pseudomonas amygdali pv. tabaci]
MYRAVHLIMYMNVGGGQTVNCVWAFDQADAVCRRSVDVQVDKKSPASAGLQLTKF